jgi:hypothetical protein
LAKEATDAQAAELKKAQKSAAKSSGRATKSRQQENA